MFQVFALHVWWPLIGQKRDRTTGFSKKSTLRLESANKKVLEKVMTDLPIMVEHPRFATIWTKVKNMDYPVSLPSDGL